jgi:DNA recombination protein RmuC
MPVPEMILWLLVGAAAGAGVAGLRSRAARRRLAECESAAATAAQQCQSKLASSEALLADLRSQLLQGRSFEAALHEKLTASEAARATSETRLACAEQLAREQSMLFERSKELLSDTFMRLAADALAANNSGFFAIAEQKFAALRQETGILWEEKSGAIEKLLGPLSEVLSAYQKETRELQANHVQNLSTVSEQLRSLAIVQSTLQTETAQLVNALKSPQVRGRWGQVQLRRVVELAGMSSHCDFTEEHTIATRLGRFRPDMVVHLPSDREVVVDAKVPLSAYLEAMEALNDSDRRAAVHKHASQIREHLRCLAAKQYWDQFAFTPEFVIMFIPNDSFLSAAAEIDPELIEAALERNVILATPSTLIALLKAIAFGWRQEKATESAQRIRELGEELSERLSIFVEHLRKLGSCLARSVESYNSAVGALESRVLVSARRFRELGAGRTTEIAEPEPVNVLPRVAG